MDQVIVGGVVGLLGAGLGAGIAATTARRGWRRQVGLEAAHMIADTYNYVWGDIPHKDLKVQLEQLRIRLVEFGVVETAIAALETAAQDCWRESYLDFDAGNTALDGSPLLAVAQVEALREAQDRVIGLLGLGR